MTSVGSVTEAIPPMNRRQEQVFSRSRLVQKARQSFRPDANFEDSVDEENAVEIDHKANPWWRDKYLCWEIKGPMSDEYKRISPEINQELNQSRREGSHVVLI